MKGRLARKEAQSMDEIIEEYIRMMKIASGLNEQRIFAAWDRVSGAAPYTLSKSVRNGTLCCRISSSVVRHQLFLQKDYLLRAINDLLQKDELFVKDDPRVGLVRNLILN